MDDQRVGRVFREVRIRKAWRQRDLADKAGVSQGLVSRIELGRLSSVSLARIRKVAAALDIRVSLDAWWRSGEVDRLIDRGHAALVEHVVASLKADGWLTRVEVTFNHFGERGSADIVAWHPTERILLIVEVKTMVGDVQATASTFERKVRILPDVLLDEWGWQPRAVARLLVIADTHGNRSVVRARSALRFGRAVPDRGGSAMAATTVDRGRRDPAWVRGHLVPPDRANGQCHGPRTAGAARPTTSGRAVTQPASRRNPGTAGGAARPAAARGLLPPPAAP